MVFVGDRSYGMAVLPADCSADLRQLRELLGLSRLRLATEGGPFHVLVRDASRRRLQMLGIIEKMPTLAAYAYRHSLGLPYVYPDNELDYTANFMNMLWKKVEPKYAANPVLARALDVLFILHADHEQNCSTSVMRAVGSSLADPFVTTGPCLAYCTGARTKRYWIC